MNHRLSLILPIGKYSFFAHACLKNIAETYGGKSDLSDLDVVVLLNNKNLSNFHLLETLKDLKKEFQFRVVKANSYSEVHLKLIDWAFRNIDLEEWVIIQHCDFFWTEENWLFRIESLLDNTSSVIRHDCGYTNFLHNGQDVELLHDYFCIYNKEKLLNFKLRLNWGKVIELAFSKLTLEKIENKELIFKSLNRTKNKLGHIQKHDWLDGSEAATLECAAHGLKIKTISLDFYHVWEFFRILDGIKIKENTLYINELLNFDNNIHRLAQQAQCSIICSYFIDKNELVNFFPWFLFKKIVSKYDPNSIDFLNQLETTIRKLERYAYTNNVYGEDEDLNLKRIVFKNKTINISPFFKNSKVSYYDIL
jgi:hypothetical protein